MSGNAFRGGRLSGKYIRFALCLFLRAFSLELWRKKFSALMRIEIIDMTRKQKRLF